MKIYNLITIIFLLVPFLLIGQTDQDSINKNPGGIDVEPNIKKEELICPISSLTEVPFDHDCNSELPKTEKFKCYEKRFNELIVENLNQKFEYIGRIYVNATILENAEIYDLKITTQPKSEKVEKLFEAAVKKIEFKAPKLYEKSVNTKVWTTFNYQ